MKNKLKFLLLSIIIGLSYFNMITIAMDNSIITHSITLSNYDILRKDNASFYINIKNTFSKKLVLKDIIVNNSNIAVVKKQYELELLPQEEKLVIVQFKALLPSTSYARVEVIYTVDNVNYSEFKDSDQFKIGETQNTIEQYFDKYFKDILLPLLIAIFSPLVLNYLIMVNENKLKNEINIKIIKSRLIYDLKKHEDQLEVNENVNTDKWEEILLGELHAFALEYFPKQFSTIENYYNSVYEYNNSKSPTERFDRTKKISNNNGNIVKLVNSLYNEKLLFSRFKAYLSSKLKLSGKISNEFSPTSFPDK